MVRDRALQSESAEEQKARETEISEKTKAAHTRFVEAFSEKIGQANQEEVNRIS